MAVVAPVSKTARGRHDVSHWLRGLAIVLPLLVLGATALELTHSRTGALRAAESQMARLSTVLAEQTDRSLEGIDRILRSTAVTIVAQPPDAMQLDNLALVLQRRAEGMQQIAGLGVADPDGRLWVSTLPALADAEAAQEKAKALIAATAAQGGDLAFSPPFQWGSGPQMALMTRRIVDAEGQLHGYAVGFIDLQNLETLYRAAQLTSHGAVVLSLPGGAVLARDPQASAAAAPRVAVSLTLRSFPLALQTSVGQSYVLRRWARRAVTTSVLTLFVCLLICGLLLLLARRAREREALVQALAEAKDAALEYGRRLDLEMAERERAEEALRKAQRLEAVGQLTGGVAHDFNNLLTVVLTNLEMAQACSQGSAELQQMLARAVEAAERGAVMTGHLLAFSRQQPLHPAPLDLDTLLHGMISLLHSALGGGVLLNMRLEAQAAAMADAGQMELVVLNLALNARDAMPGGGTLTISTQDVTRGPPQTPEQPAAGAYVLIEVRDTGVGMSAETRNRVFDPFFTTKGPGAGSGLGLSQVYGVARQSGGWVELDSRLHEGTVVRVWLPQATAGLAPKAALLAPPCRCVAGPLTILVVDDDEAVRDATVHLLTRQGYQVLEDPSAEAALKRLRDGAAVSVILSDIVMPGISGLDLARAVRQMHPGLPFVFMSGFADPGSVGADLGPLQLIRKPFRASVLIAQIEAAVMRHPGESRAGALPKRCSASACLQA